MDPFCFPQKPETQNASVVVPGMAILAQAHAFVAIIYQKQLLYDAALVHLLHVGLIAAFAFDMQNYAQFINAAKHAFSSPTNRPIAFHIFHGYTIFRSPKFKYCFPSFGKKTTMVPKLKQKLSSQLHFELRSFRF